MNAAAPTSFVVMPSGAAVELREPPIDSGGEGEIYLVNQRSRVLKRIFKPTPIVIKKLRWMFEHAPPRDTPWSPQDLAWPEGLVVVPGTQEVCGYTAIYFANSVTLETVFERAARIKAFPGWTYAHLVNLAANLAKAFERAHRLGLILGDVSSRNALCDARTYVKLIDLESAQICSGNLFLPCLVATTDYAAPELQAAADYSTFRRSAFHDSFGLAALIYQILSDGVHPYYGTVETPAGVKDLPPGMGERISKNLWPHSSSKAGKPRVMPPPDACDFAAFPRQLQDLFFRAFDEGHANPSRRPSPGEFAGALAAHFQALSTCAANPKHRFACELRACPWCERRAALHIDSFPL